MTRAAAYTRLPRAMANLLKVASE